MSHRRLYVDWMRWGMEISGRGYAKSTFASNKKLNSSVKRTKVEPLLLDNVNQNLRGYLNAFWVQRWWEYDALLYLLDLSWYMATVENVMTLESSSGPGVSGCSAAVWDYRQLWAGVLAAYMLTAKAEGGLGCQNWLFYICINAGTLYPVHHFYHFGQM